MKHTLATYILIGSEALVGLTAVAGGIGLMTGWIPMPLSLLHHSLFINYMIPGLVLSVIVGGSAIIACILLLIDSAYGQLLAFIAGFLLLEFMTMEIAIIGLTVWYQLAYIGISILSIFLAIYVWIVKQ